MKQTIVIVAGPDMTGKTQIAKELAIRLGNAHLYFKSSTEHDAFLSSRTSKRELFLNQLRYADPRVVDLLKQTGQSVIFDRGYPCEFAYSKVFERETDTKMLRHLDEEWSKLDACIILCYRNNYDGITDDLDPSIEGKTLQKIHDVYMDFAGWTKCKLLKLNVDDENLDREISEVLQFIGWKQP